MADIINLFLDGLQGQRGHSFRSLLGTAWGSTRCQWLTDEQKSSANYRHARSSATTLVFLAVTLTILEPAVRAVVTAHRNIGTRGHVLGRNIVPRALRSMIRQVATDLLWGVVLLILALVYLTVVDGSVRWPLHACPVDFEFCTNQAVRGVIASKVVVIMAGLRHDW